MEFLEVKAPVLAKALKLAKTDASATDAVEELLETVGLGIEAMVSSVPSPSSCARPSADDFPVVAHPPLPRHPTPPRRARRNKHDRDRVAPRPGLATQRVTRRSVRATPPPCFATLPPGDHESESGSSMASADSLQNSLRQPSEDRTTGLSSRGASTDSL